MKILLVSSTKKEIEYYVNNKIDTFIIGIGIPNTILNLTSKLSKERYDLVINAGICGSFKNEYEIGDIVEVINDKFSEIGYEEGCDIKEFNKSFKIKTNFRVKPQTDLPHVSGITVNTVHGNRESIDNIVNLLNPDVETMEGAGVFMVCEYFSIPCVQIRAVSNIVEERNKNKWNISLAVENLNIEIDKIISNL